MKFPWDPISRPFSEAEDEYDAIVVGSGYGGGVAGSRLARAGVKVAILERGREIAPGQYPRDMAGAAEEMQVRLSHPDHACRIIGKRDGLYDFRVGDDVNVLLGCGVGGTSLINANVAIEPERRVYRDWPEPYRNDPDLLAPFYERACEMLGSRPYPAGKTPPKLAALEKVGEGLGAPVWRPKINVTFEAGANHAGVWQEACTDCGDCVSGCNYGAKNTVLMNYLPDAVRHGGVIFNGAEVRSVKKTDAGWQVVVQAAAGDELAVLKARVVVLAAGTLGTTEILKRSEQEGLKLSDRLGKGFSTNGDVWAFGYNANMPDGKGGRLPVYGVGAGINDVVAGPTPPEDEPYKPGPCITGVIDMRDPAKPLQDGLIIEEGVMPGALAPAYAAAFPMLDALMGDPLRFNDAPKRLEDAEALGTTLEEDPLAFVATAYDGPVSRTIPYLVMSHDGSDGTLEFDGDTVVVSWQGAGLDSAFIRDDRVLKRGSDGIQAEYLPNPLWQDAFNNRVVTVHPLGGCAMGDSIETGVINERCNVFDPDGGTHKGLYVMDGAAIPKGVGVNPHLAITAVAERAVALLAEDFEWTIDMGEAEALPIMRSVEDADFDVAGVLSALIDGMSQIKAAIDNRAWELAQMLLRGVWRQILAWVEAHPIEDLPDLELPDVDTFIETYCNPDRLQDMVGPILGQALEILVPVKAALDKGDTASIVALLEEKLGDFSPQVNFKERMTGHLTTAGLHDPDPIADPYQVATAGKVNAEFTAEIRASAVRDATVPGGHGASLNNGELHADALGGTCKLKTGSFLFLQPQPAKIEAWEMIYEADMIGPDGAELHFRGVKTLQYREGSHWWRDLTELRVDITDAEGPVARGMLTVGFEDLIVQAKNLDISYTLIDLATALLLVNGEIQKTEINHWAKMVEGRAFRANCVKALLYFAPKIAPKADVQGKLASLYAAQVFARMGGLVLRSYGGIFAYMMNFPARSPKALVPRKKIMLDPVVYYPEPEPNVYLKLTRYEGGDKGPVMLAGGFGTKASSFALQTVDTNIVEVLVDRGYDVWLFDYRGSGDILASRSPFTIDDVARRDWPAAIDVVTRRTGRRDVQILVHCVGSMSLFMAVLAGESRVRSIVASQLGPHAITNWFNYAKGDARLATAIREGLPKSLWPFLDAFGVDGQLADLLKSGIPVVDPCSPGELGCSKEMDRLIDGLVWNVPSFAPVPSLSPTCHRINAIFGPSFRYEQLNQATHNAIGSLFGPVASAPFQHIAKIFRHGHAISADGRFDYLSDPAQLSMPVHFIAGGRNQQMLPEASLRTHQWLVNHNGNEDGRYTRKVYPQYGHMDCFIGQHASEEIFDDLVAELEKTARDR